MPTTYQAAVLIIASPYFYSQQNAYKHKQGKQHWRQVSGKDQKQAKEKSKWRIKQLKTVLSADRAT